MTAVIVAVSAAVGLAIGSFLDVLAYRLPRGLSISRPGSFCPACRTPLAWTDNVPVISWLVLRGRCRTCSCPIPGRILLVEAGTALAFAGVALAMGRSWAIPGLCLLVAAVLANVAAAIDGVPLPDGATVTATAIGVAALVGSAAGTGHWGHLTDAALGVAGGGLVSMVVSIVVTRTPGADRRPRGSEAPDPTSQPGRATTVAGRLSILLPIGAFVGWLGLVPAAGAAAGALLAAAASILVLVLGTRYREEEPAPDVEPAGLAQNVEPAGQQEVSARNRAVPDRRQGLQVATAVVALAAMVGALSTTAATTRAPSDQGTVSLAYEPAPPNWPTVATTPLAPPVPAR